MKPRPLHISAFGIHTGGGLVLLRALLAARGAREGRILLDARVPDAAVDLPAGTHTSAVRRSFAARWLALSALAGAARDGEVLLCFNSLPPMRRSAAKVVTFVQAPHFAGLDQGIRYSPLTTVRLRLEAAWFAAAARFSDEIWVQTRSMAALVGQRFPDARLRMAPLVDDRLDALLRSRAASAREATALVDAATVFFYPADGVGHKNHLVLLRAWQALARCGHQPRLRLTLDDGEWALVWRELGSEPSSMPQVATLGRLPRERVLEEMRAASALLFPSRAETFGLPMLEARGLGVPILAAERDFVRDVCTPAHTFDPESPTSLADAVLRFMQHPAPALEQAWTAARFVDELLA